MNTARLVISNTLLLSTVQLQQIAQKLQQLMVFVVFILVGLNRLIKSNAMEMSAVI